jgi:hypothetical protein
MDETDFPATISQSDVSRFKRAVPVNARSAERGEVPVNSAPQHQHLIQLP